MTSSPPFTDDQLDAALAALAGPASFSAADLVAARTRVIAAVDPVAPCNGPTGVPVPTAISVTAASHRRFARAALVAAAVLVLVTTLAVVLVQAARPGGTGPAGGRAEVACLVDPGRPTPGATERARTLLTDRLAGLAASGSGVTSPAVRPDGSGRLLVTAEGIDRQGLGALCASPRPAMRPLLTAPIALPAGAGCGAPAVGTGAGDVVCDRADEPTVAYRVGPAVVQPSGFADAVATPPFTPEAGWTVEVTFEPSAQEAVAAYTSAHNAGGTSAVSPCGGPGTTPCDRFLAIVVGGVVVQAPGIQTAITGSLQVSGTFDRSEATLLAAELAAGDTELIPAG